MTSLWFVTPAWKRYEMTAVCLEQRRRVIEALAGNGIEAHQVVIADDENLDIARAVGAHTVEAPNVVASKFNDGMEYAGKHGAEWIVPIGSDSWIDPAFFLPIPDPKHTRTSPFYAAVQRNRIAQLVVAPRNPNHMAGPYVFHRSLLEPAGFRPSAEDSVMVDTSTVAGIVEATGKPVPWKTHDIHPFQYVGFRVEPMMTTYASLTRHWLVRERPDPWAVLRRYYPADLVERARQAMEASAEVAA